MSDEKLREALALGVDKTDWGPGPWLEEPDRVEFRHAGFPCLLNRNDLGSWCGYVAVPPGHPLHGHGYNDAEVDVHGGLTYAGACQGHICHVPQPGEPEDVWWFGFDCGHCWDFTPGMNHAWAEIGGRPGGWGRDEIYRDLPYVRHETESLAEQLAGVTSIRPAREVRLTGEVTAEEKTQWDAMLADAAETLESD